MSKRIDYISWNEYFMEIAKLSAKRSKDPNTNVGCCIINNNKIIGTGYNGLPINCNDDEYTWSSPEKYNYVVHAEANAIINTSNFNLLKDSVLYTTLFPCNECAKLIIQCGIKKIIYLDDKYHNKPEFIASRKMLDSANILYIQYI